MTEPPNTPVIILAFSNDQDDYLRMIVRERKSIFKALQRHDDFGYIRIHTEENTTVEDLFDLLNRYRDRVVIVHYGGHANGTHLMLENTLTGVELANAAGLAQLMGQQAGLQLMFLNGCATKDQVQKLFATGVKAVIATSVPIDDAIATEFAEQFYNALANRASIQRAFHAARAFVVTRYGQSKEVGEFRGIGWIDERHADVNEIPWGLYVNTSGESALGWKLPELAEHQVIIRNTPTAAPRKAQGNAGLMETLFNAIARRSSAVGALWEVAQTGGRRDIRMVRQQIIDSFPAPIGEHLRKLFAGNATDVPRLRQVVITYEMVSQFYCFTLLSQLWDARFNTPAMQVSREYGEVFRSVFARTENSVPTFDYNTLSQVVTQVLAEHGLQPFVAEVPGLEGEHQHETLEPAYQFMEHLKGELGKGKIPSEEIGGLCDQAEQHLGTILSSLSFLVLYKLTTIKRVDVIKARHRLPQYRHTQVVLDRVTAGIMDTEEVYSSFTDTESVILLRDTNTLKEYLSLSPFVIDEHAFTGDENSKLFFFSHHDVATDSYHFTFVDNVDDVLVITGDNYPQIKRQFEDFNDAVFGG